MTGHWNLRVLVPILVSACLAATAFGQTPFDNVTDDVGLAGMSESKAAWGDFNNDGLVDLLASSEVWRNDGGTFTRLQDVGSAGIWGDYNNDGFLDIFCYSNKTLWRNVDGTSFVNDSAILPTFPTNAPAGAAWADFNNDGYIDLYIGGWEAPDSSVYYPDLILINNAGASFALDWQEPTRNRPARGVTACDFDEDHDQDIYASNYRLEANYLWRNDGALSFSDVAAAYGAAGDDDGYYYSFGHTIGSCWGDLDNDGHFDLFVGNFSHSHAHQDRPKFLRNLGPGGSWHFEDMSATAALAWQESFASPALGDFDNDGDLDIVFTCVYSGDHTVLLRNDGGWVFTDVTSTYLPTNMTHTYQAAWADYDNDGDLDLACDGKLFRNPGNGNSWVKFKLVGTPPGVNRAAIGAQVRVSLGAETLARQVEGGTGEGDQNDLTLHFGLGSRTDPVDVTVTWPDGAEQTLTVPVNTTTTIAQADRLLAVRSQPVPGVSITGTYPGTTDYFAGLDIGESVALTAPDTTAYGYGQYTFSHWILGTTPQPAGQRTVTFSIETYQQAKAVYAGLPRDLHVQSTSVTGVTITGTPSGTTNYDTTAADDSEVTLTAPEWHLTGDDTYRFLRWQINDPPPAGLSTGLVGRWKLDEGVGTTAPDSSGVGNSGAIHGPAWELVGDDYITSFDGDDDYVECTAGGALDSLSHVTLSVWVYPDSVPASGERWIAGKDFSRFLLTYYAGDSHCWWYTGGGGSYCRTPLNVGAWNHLVGTYDGATLRVYVNGVLKQENPIGSVTIPTGGTVKIGGVGGGGDVFFEGDVGDVKVYNRALPLSEIQAQYSLGRGQPKQLSGVQPDGQTTVTFSIQQETTALAHFELIRPVLQVRSTPVSGVAITGTHGGTTDYSVEVDNGTAVSLTAPDPSGAGGPAFVRWHLVENLVAHYPFDEGSGTTANDASGHENHGTIHGGTWAKGVHGYGIELDGVDDYVECAPTPSLQIESAGTILLWYKPDVCQGGLVNWSTGTSWPDERLVLVFNGDQLGFYMSNGTTHQNAYSGPWPPTWQWSHVAVTFDGTTVSTYRDGTPVYSEPQTITPNIANVLMWIGRSQGLGPGYFDGLIDEVRIYNRALTAAEVAAERGRGPGMYAGTPQTEGQTTLATTISKHTVALAEYASASPLIVDSGSPRGVAVTGTHPGTTRYDVVLGNGTETNLTAPESASQGGSDYAFERWRVTEDLLAYYPFDEGSGSVAGDASGRGNHGVIHGATWAEGLHGGALSFDGTDDYVDCGMRENLTIQSAGTILLWFKPDVCQGGLVNWCTGSSWPSERLVLVFYGETFGFYFSDGTSVQHGYQGALPPVGEWSHIAVTFDGANVNVYRDGSPAYGETQLITPSIANVPMWIGRSSGLGPSFYDGLIDEVRIYGRVLTADEIAAEHGRGPGLYAGTAKPEGTRTLTHTVTQTTIAAAEYGPGHQLRVQSTPLTAVEITGTDPGTTNYQTVVGEADSVTLTAPDTASSEGAVHAFVRWHLVEDLVAYYPLDEGSGGVAYDASGHGNHGTLNGPTWATGAYGGGLSFDGEDDYVDCGMSDVLAFTGSFTLSARVRHEVVGGWQDYVGNYHTGGFVLAASGSGLYFYNLGVDPVSMGAGSGVPGADVWFHVAGVYDQAAGTMTLYVNGDPLASQAVTGRHRPSQARPRRRTSLSSWASTSGTRSGSMARSMRSESTSAP